MKPTQIYFFANTPPPSYYDQINTVIADGINWGNAVGLGVLGILMALSIAAYLFKK
jgi:hypothetical protein